MNHRFVSQVGIVIPAQALRRNDGKRVRHGVLHQAVNIRKVDVSADRYTDLRLRRIARPVEKRLRQNTPIISLKPRSLKKKLRNVHRMDYAVSGTHGWLVQVQRRNDIATRMFTDGVYGGYDRSLRAALAWRNAILRRRHDKRYELWRRNRKRRNNTSGIVGVGRYLVSGRSKPQWYWLAFWDDARGKRVSRKFSVSKYGEGKARALAIRVRRDALNLLYESN